MAVGDKVVYGAEDVANNGTTDCQPGSGVEIVLHTLEAQQGKSMEVYRTNDGTNFALLMTLSAGGLVDVRLHCTNTVFIRLKNVSGGAAGNFALGVQTK